MYRVVKNIRALWLAGAWLLVVLPAAAQNLPLHVQGRVTVNGIPFNSGGFFKFALVTGNTTLWSHDGTSVNGNEPSGSVPLTVTKGLYNVLLGDLNVFGMTQPIPAGLFANNDGVALRVWFNDGARGFQRLIPDQRIGAVGFALNAQTADVAATLTGQVPLNLLPPGIVTNNAGNLTLSGSFSGSGAGLANVPGAVPWQVISGRAVQAAPQQGYIITTQEGTTVRLPVSPNVGDVFRVSGASAGSWRITQGDNQSIKGQFTSEVGAVWMPRAPSRDWRAIAMSSDGSRLLAVGSGVAIHTSIDFGFNWTPRAEMGLRDFRCAASSADGNTLIVGANNSFISVSTDAGVSWRDQGVPGLANWTGVASSASGQHLVAVANPGVIMTSSDSGANWTPRAPSRAWQAAACSADGVTQVAVAANDFVYVSVNSGATWNALPASGQRAWKAVAISANATRIVAAIDNGPVLITYLSGGQWNGPWNNLFGTGAWTGVAASHDGAALIGVRSNGPISVSTDYGTTVLARESARNWTAVAASVDGRRFAATVLGGNIYTSEPSPITTTTAGATGSLTGGPFAAVELQYAGNNIFFPISSAGTLIAR